MSAALRIDPRTRHIVEAAVFQAISGAGPIRTEVAVDILMSLEFEVVGVGPNGEQALCAIDPESSVKP